MTNLQRLTGKIFGETATATGDDPQIGQFGSALNGTYVGTTDVATIQSLPAWSNGFIDSVTPNEQFPPLPEMTGFGKVLSYQTAYTLQKGVPEWDAGTTYYTGDFAKGIGEGKLYVSKVDDNINNDLSDTTYWEEFVSSGSRNIGEIVASTIPLTDAGLHLLDGSLIQGSGSYSAFVDYIAGLVTDYPDLFVTESDWQTAITTYGVCGKFVYDSVNNTVRLPKYGNQIITKTSAISTASTVPVVGTGKALGLTDGTVNAGLLADSTSKLLAYKGVYGHDVQHNSLTGEGSPANQGFYGVTTNPTKSGLVADISSIKNYPLDCYYYIVIATSTKTSIQVDIDEIATDLNGKADVDLTNCTDVADIKMAHNAMPSNTYIDLTLGASGSTYTAPADGWFYVNKIAGADWHYVIITNTSKVNTGYSDWRSDYRTSPLTPMLPVQKGDVVEIVYNATGATQAFKFIYAQGSEKEAN